MNHGAKAVTLVGVASTEASVEMHTTRTEDAGTSMRPLEQVVIEPDQQTVFRPGGHHLMIREISSGALAAQSLPVELILANGSRLPSALDIVPMSEWMQGSAGDHSMH
jgi:copper(I)-binding protein